MITERSGILLTVCSAAGFATLAVLIKLAYSAGANTQTVMTGRFILAAGLMWLTLCLRGINPHITHRRSIYMLVVAAVFYVMMSSLFALSIIYLPASLAGLILYTYPALVALLSAGLGDEILTKRKLLALSVCFGGLFLTLGVTFQSIDVRGIWLGLGAAAVFSIYIVLSNRILKNVQSLVASTYICSVAAVIFTVMSLSSSSITYPLPWSGWLSITGIAFFATYIGVLCFLAGISSIGGPAASIISTIEPAITVVLSFVFLDERLTLLQVGGGLLILFGILILQMPADKQKAAQAN